MTALFLYSAYAAPQHFVQGQEAEGAPKSDFTPQFAPLTSRTEALCQIACQMVYLPSVETVPSQTVPSQEVAEVPVASKVKKRSLIEMVGSALIARVFKRAWLSRPDQ